MFMDIFVENGTHVQGFLVKKKPFRVAHPCMSSYVSTPLWINVASLSPIVCHETRGM